MAGSLWIKLDADYFGHPKALAAGVNGRALHLASICWALRYLTDGRVPAVALPNVLHEAGVSARAVEQVVGAGLWLPNGDGFTINDYDEHQRTRAAIERRREQWREAQAKRRQQPVIDDAALSQPRVIRPESESETETDKDAR